MKHFGLDVHKKSSKVVWIDDETGEVGKSRSVPTAYLVSHLSTFAEEKVIVLETGAQSRFLACQLMSLPQTNVLVVDAFKAHRGLEGLNPGRKTDKLDAQGLALLSVRGACEAMAVWLADDQTRDLRVLTRTRQVLVAQGTAVQNQIRALLKAEGLECDSTELLSHKAQRQLEQLATGLSPLTRSCLELLREMLGFIKERVRTVDGQLHELAQNDERCQKLQTIPGCGEIIATAVIAEIGTVERFAQASQLRSYAGLTPSISQSGERAHTGPLTKGNPHLKYVLVMLAQHFSSHHDFDETRLKRSYYRCLHRHGPNPAKVALARHLCEIIFAMLRDGTDFQRSLLATGHGPS